MKKHFLSLGTKIVLLFFVLLASASAAGIFFFMQDYAVQAREDIQTRVLKSQLLTRLYQENNNLRSLIAESEKGRIPMSAEAVLKQQRQFLKDSDTDDLSMAFRGDLIKDANKFKEQAKKMDSLGWISAIACFGIFLFLSVMWVVVRRLILLPAEQMTLFSQKFAAGDLTARIPVSDLKSDNDEMDFLARNLNKMAQTIDESFEKERQRQLFLQNLIDSLPEGVRVIDENKNIVIMNKTCRELFKELSLPDAVKCYECAGFKRECSDGKALCPLGQIGPDTDAPVKVIHSYTAPSGRDFFVEVSVKLLNDMADGKKLILEVIRSLDKDIRFSHAQKLSSIGLLAESVAHELRNPLGAARLILENIIEKKMLPDETNNYLNLILEQMSFCIGITERLLKLSRKAEKEKEPVDVNKIMAETVSLLEYEAKKNGVDIKQDFCEPEAVIKASDPEMRMVFLNLMQNAFHAMSDGGVLSLSSAAEGDEIVIRVSDTGCGIAPENLNRIFEPFFSEGRPNGEGTGLGLPIVKNIVEGIGGKISVASERGKGTSFEIRLRKNA